MKTAIYARVSDDKLKEDGERRQDINRQIDKLKSWSAAMGVVIAEEDVFRDDGLSAYKEDYQSRPAFVKLIRQVHARQYQRVLIEDLSRWSRRLEDGLKTLKDASDNGCTVTSLHESEIDVTSANGWFKAAISLMFAEWSSRIMSEKVKSGMERRANDQRHFCESCGKIHLGRHPNACNCLNCRDRRIKKGRVESRSNLV